MEIALSAFLGELANRSISFILQKLSNHASALSMEQRLRSKLLRARVITEEAERRQITSQAMLEQLKMLQEGMFQGSYVLDTFNYQGSQGDNGKAGHHGVSHYFALSKFNPAKRVQLSRGSTIHRERELQQVLGRLEITIADASEFVMFLRGCPPLYRQPCSSHLFFDKCMFGRHAEMEYIINFLLHTRPSGTEDNPDVLPIIGPAKVGKSTLIEQACKDERIRNAFARIMLFTEDARKDERLATLRDGAIIMHHKHTLRGEIDLVIVEVDEDIDDALWRRLYSAWKIHATNGSKIIISSRSDKIASFGTTRALRVQYLTREAYWCFFKTLAFGSMDPEDTPKLASVAMDIAADMNGSFIFGNIMASTLRANFNTKFWITSLSCVRECRRRYPFIFGGHPGNHQNEVKEACVRIINGRSEYCTISNGYQVVSAFHEAPMKMMQDVLSGSVVPDGKFQVLAWRSPIPPHYSYIFSCEIQRAQHI